MTLDVSGPAPEDRPRSQAATKQLDSGILAPLAIHGCAT
jgi:hypothetical protein